MAKKASMKLPGMISIPGSSALGKDGKNINIKQAMMAPKLLQNWSDAKENASQEAMKSWMGLSDSIKNVAATINAGSVKDATKTIASTMD